MRGQLGVVVALVLVATLVRLPGFQDSLWFDEIYYTDAYFEDPVKRRFLLAWQDLHPPLYAFFMIGWTQVFGNSEVAVRLPSLLAGLGTLLGLWRLALAWWGPGPARLVGLLLALSPPHIWYSRENRVNMLVVLLVTAAVGGLWAAAEGRGRRAWILGSLALLAALYTHLYALPVATALAVWLVWRSLREPELRRPTGAAIGLVILAWLPAAVFKLLTWGQSMQREYLRDFTLAEAYKLLLAWLPHGNTIRTLGSRDLWAQLSAQPGPLFLIDLFVALVLLRGIVEQLRQARGVASSAAWTARLLLLWFLCPLALAWIIPRGYIERSLMVALPPFLLLLVSGARERFLQAGLVALSLTGVVVMLYGKPEAPTVVKPKPDWRAAAAWLGTQEGRLELFVTCPTNEPLYYRPPGRVLIHEMGDGGILSEARRAGWRPNGPLYLVLNKTWKGSWERVWPEFRRDPGLVLVEVRRFFCLDIYKFVPTPGRNPAEARLDLGGPAQSMFSASGFHPGEAAAGATFVWSAGRSSRLSIPLSPEAEDYRLLVRARRVDGIPAVAARLRLNGQALGELIWTTPGFHTLEVDVPRAALREGENALELDYAQQMRLSPTDPRSSSLCLDRIDLIRASR